MVGTQLRLLVMENDGHGHFAVKTVLPMRDFDVPSYDGDVELSQGLPPGAQQPRQLRAPRQPV